jgi:RNA polymerase sigma factor (sigma-70 family)
VSRHEQAVLVADAVVALPEASQEIIILRHLQELSFPEIARRTGRSLDSVKNLWIRGLRRLRKTLEERP